MRHTLIPCRFSFDDGPAFDGYTDGTTWNGFNNVWVTPETHAAVIAAFDAQGWPADDFHALTDTAELHGALLLVSYAYGYATTIEAPLRVGDVVQYREVLEPGDDEYQYDVVELRGDRALIRVRDWPNETLVPTTVAPLADLVRAD